MDSIGMSCIKYLLFLFNLLFAISGIVILTIGIMIQQKYSNYKIFIDEKLFSLPVIFIIVGVLIFIVAFFGCCGAIQESNYMLITFAALLCLIFFMEAAGGIGGYIMKEDIHEKLSAKMYNSLRNSYKYDIDNNTWNALQVDLSCCGVRSFKDWADIYDGALPLSCCPHFAIDESCVEQHATQNGCLPALENALEQNIFSIIAFALTVAFVQLIGVIFACCMSRSIRKYETV
ncbi:CD63 antigen [Halyomorpha halys]|uniref:CD63 antigen n=1 Tax=Halyomorpha halys TaxID=286706 RepID=UPI0006D4F446|nr:CD63 antigen [Halyomorpha halys]